MVDLRIYEKYMENEPEWTCLLCLNVKEAIKECEKRNIKYIYGKTPKTNRPYFIVDGTLWDKEGYELFILDDEIIGGCRRTDEAKRRYEEHHGDSNIMKRWKAQNCLTTNN